MKKNFAMTAAAVLLGTALAASAMADATPQAPPYTQNWAGTDALMAVGDDWSTMPGFIGYLNVVSPPGTTAVNPQTILTLSDIPDLVINSTTTTGTGGVHEIADTAVGLQGSGTARCPNLALHLNLTAAGGGDTVSVAFDAIQLDADTATQPLTLQYKLAADSEFTDIPSSFISNVAGTVSRNVGLPPAVNGQNNVIIRWITCDAAGTDKMVGIDNISVTIGAAPPGPSVTGVTPSADGLSVVVHYSKNMTTGGTYTVQPGAISPSGASATGGNVTLTFAAPLVGFPTVFTVEGTNVVATDTGVSAAVTTSGFYAGVTSMAQIRSTMDGTTGLTSIASDTVVLTRGIVVENYVDNFRQISMTLSDDNGGLQIRRDLSLPSSGNGFGAGHAIGDMVQAIGTVTHFNGLTQVAERLGLPFASILSSGNALPDPVGITMPATFANMESLEGRLARIQNVAWVVGAAPGSVAPTEDGDGTWVTLMSGSGQDYQVTTAANPNSPNADTILAIRVDRDVRNGNEPEGPGQGAPNQATVPDPLTGNPVPTGRFDVVGLVSQFDNAGNRTEGYQLLVLGDSAFGAATTPASAHNAWTLYE